MCDKAEFSQTRNKMSTHTYTDSLTATVAKYVCQFVVGAARVAGWRLRGLSVFVRQSAFQSEANQRPPPSSPLPPPLVPPPPPPPLLHSPSKIISQRITFCVDSCRAVEYFLQDLKVSDRFMCQTELLPQAIDCRKTHEDEPAPLDGL